jgi:predicted enzyme related to lactoylglutathione lyase
MAEDRYIPGVPCWVNTSQADVRAAVEFYGALFGWELEDAMPPGSPDSYFIARMGGEDVGAIASGTGDRPASWDTYVWVESADDTAQRVRDAGGTVITEPFDVGDSGRMAVCADREGASFCLWQPGRHRGATRVNEHGSVNFNDLHTRDLGAAKAFYGAVFGWETLQLGEGGVWTLQAYGDFLERRTPGMRENMAAMGAPPGFEAAVAAFQPIADDTPAHWGVTFAVDDADATADRAEQLGGRVLLAPFDAPWVRMAIIADPAGATFVASTFKPENKDLQPESPAAAGSA